MVEITFPSLRDDWSLDVVNILAFLGEHNILAYSQQICMSWTCFLPRLIPAPQGLLVQRPKNLASGDDVSVQGLFSGNSRHNLQYFGRMLHTDGSDLDSFTTRVLNIDWESDGRNTNTIRPKLFSQINLIAIFSCVLSFGLAAWACVLGDAPALTGILVMSFTTPLLYVGMRWSPPIFRRNMKQVHPSDLVVISPRMDASRSLSVKKKSHAVPTSILASSIMPSSLSRGAVSVAS